MTLDKSQLQYIEHRIWNIKRDFEAILEERRDAEIQANFKEENDYKVDLFQNGRVKIKTKIVSASNLEDVFDLPKNWNKPFADARKKIRSKYQIMETTLKNKTTELWDELILGDQEKALKMLREFENYKI